MRIPYLEALRLVRAMCAYEVVPIEPELIESAIELSVVKQVSYWDALVIAAAAKARCKRLLTEDTQSAIKLLDVLIENPFR